MRTGLEELCPKCRLRLPRETGHCPFCEWITLGPDDPSRHRKLERSSWDPVLPARAMRWVALVLGAPSVLPLPLILLAVPLLTLAFGTPADREPSEFAMSSSIAGPGVFLALAIIVPILVATLAIAVLVPCGLVSYARRRWTIEPCVRDVPPPAAEPRLAPKIHRARRWLWVRRERLARWKTFGIAAAVLATILVVASFVVRREDFLPWSAALVGLFGVAIAYFAGLIWFGVVLTTLEWLTGGVGLVPRARERGRQRFDGAREARAMVAAWTRGREGHTGTLVGGERVTAPLGGDAVLAYRVRGRAGIWSIDDAVVGSALEVRLDDGRTLQVRSPAWALLAETGEPQPVDGESAALKTFLARLGVPAFGRLELAERVLREGDRVRLHGDLGRELAPGQGYRGELGSVLTGTSRKPVVIAAA